MDIYKQLGSLVFLWKFDVKKTLFFWDSDQDLLFFVGNSLVGVFFLSCSMDIRKGEYEEEIQPGLIFENQPLDGQRD